MQSLREKLLETSEFLLGVELVSVRGSMAEARAVRVRDLAAQLIDCPRIDWISVTDNAGGNPQLAPQALAKPILYAGKEVVIHLTCKDLNRNGLESAAWQLESEGFRNVLALTGDYPVGGNEGMAKPVFDLDSVGLISLLSKMNRGFDDFHGKTSFCIGGAVCNHKLREGEVVPQYLKLAKKIECGAHFIITQVGFDARKAGELRRYMSRDAMACTPLIGNVFLLSLRSARMFHAGHIPGIVVTDALLQACEAQGRGPDEGKAFFEEFAAKQMAVFRGLGYRGVYLGGIHDVAAVDRILALEHRFAPDDWKQFAREIAFSQPGEFFLYEDETDASSPRGAVAASATFPSPRVEPLYGLSKRVHAAMFTPGQPLSNWGASVCRRASDQRQGPALLRAVERLSKGVLYQCKDCGDCSLPDVAFLCPESQCAKNQRNGPCGGTRGGRCEVDGYRDCIWLRAYERLKREGRERQLLAHAPVLQNQGLRGTSSWANNWLGRDHAAHGANGAGHP